MNRSKPACLGLLVIIMAACGGGGSTNGPLTCASAGAAACTGGGSAVVPTVPATTLATSVSTLALWESGTHRTITVTNIGSDTAIGVATNMAGSSSGFGVFPLSCGDIAPGGSCVLTVSPGFTATAAPGDPSPAPIPLGISGTNTSTITVFIHVLTYGSVYQSGYVFAVDDSTPVNTSIGGKVVQLQDQAATIWSATSDPVPGIDETNATNCDGKSDGACNTGKITAVYSATSPTTYAAGLCTQTIDGLSDWYLPAICELGYDGTTAGTGCGTSSAPTIQNMQTSLTDNGGLGNFTGGTQYWSSTLVHSNVLNAWAHVTSPEAQIGLAGIRTTSAGHNLFRQANALAFTAVFAANAIFIRLLHTNSGRARLSYLTQSIEGPIGAHQVRCAMSSVIGNEDHPRQPASGFLCRSLRLRWRQC